MADKAKVGVVGTGWWAGVLARASAQSGELAVVSCYSRTPENREAFAGEHGCRAASSLEELLADPEVQGVLVATSHTTHREVIEAAAEAGKHVFVEKPLALRTSDARAAVEAARKAGVRMQVGHQRRRAPAHRRVRELIDGGQIGDLQLLEAHHSLPNGFRLPPDAWRRNPEESPLGSMTSLGIHQIDNFLYLGGPIRRVFTFTRPGREVTIDEATALAFEFESGAVGSLLTSFFTPFLIRLSVHGTTGTAFADDDGRRLSYQKSGEADRSEIDLPEVDTVVDQMAEFGRVVRGEAEPEVGGDQGLQVVAVFEAAVASSRSGKAEEIAAFGG